MDHIIFDGYYGIYIHHSYIIVITIATIIWIVSQPW